MSAKKITKSSPYNEGYLAGIRNVSVRKEDHTDEFMKGYQAGNNDYGCYVFAGYDARCSKIPLIDALNSVEDKVGEYAFLIGYNDSY